MVKKLLLFIGLFSLFVWNVEARKQSLFRVENDTILHICSNLSDMDCLDFYVSDDNSDYFTYPFWRIKNIVIDEGVDSVYFGLYLISAKRLSIPSSLKDLYLEEVPPGLEEVRLSAKNPNYRWENGALYNRDKTLLYFMLPCAEDSVLQFPETVELVWTIPKRYYPKDTLYLKDLPSRHWEGYLERYPINIHFSKVIIPERCKPISGYIDCDTLIIHSAYSLEGYLNDHVMSRLSYLYCLSDSAVAHILMEDLWDSIKWNYRRAIDRRKIHCPNYDIRKRDTSWMRDSYRLTCVMENGDTLVGVDTISSERRILSVMIEGIADENVRFCEKNGRYRFYVTTYDTLYRLPLEVFVKLKEQKTESKPKPKCSDFGEVRDSVFIIREGVDSLPYLSDRPSSFRKVIIPKSMRYMEGGITCDSVFIYSDSLDGAYYIDADYYYVENEQLYLLIKRRLMKDRSAVVYCPNADIRKRDLSLQKNTNPLVWRDEQDNVIDLSNLRHTNFWQYLQLTIEGIEPGNLWVFYEWKDRKYMMKYSWERDKDGSEKCLWWVPASHGDLELEYAVWTYDTLLTLPQKTQVRIVKQNGSPWEGDFSPTSCLYYVPKGETCESLMNSGKKIMYWKSGDTIPRRYLKRLALGLLYKNGECEPMEGRISYRLDWKDNRNYLYTISFDGLETVFLQIPPNHSKEVWMLDIGQLDMNPRHVEWIKRIWSPIHFYVGR
ncbi:MAG: hypothetical protein IJ916_07420 [Paludibacteraceae bacterium]|nr:hypothetical protein [Paludibacteraceae bacterium]